LVLGLDFWVDTLFFQNVSLLSNLKSLRNDSLTGGGASIDAFGE
jgi:hypothetical protein